MIVHNTVSADKSEKVRLVLTNCSMVPPIPLNSVWQVALPCAWRDCAREHSCVYVATAAAVVPSHNSAITAQNAAPVCPILILTLQKRCHQYMGINQGYNVLLYQFGLSLMDVNESHFNG